MFPSLFLWFKVGANKLGSVYSSFTVHYKILTFSFIFIFFFLKKNPTTLKTMRLDHAIVQCAICLQSVPRSKKYVVRVVQEACRTVHKLYRTTMQLVSYKFQYVTRYNELFNFLSFILKWFLGSRQGKDTCTPSWLHHIPWFDARNLKSNRRLIKWHGKIIQSFYPSSDYPSSKHSVPSATGASLWC